MAKLKIGDIYEVQTRRGLAYIQYVHDIRRMGEFVRIIPGFFDDEPGPDVASVLSRLLVCYPLRAAVKQGLVRKVCNAPVPASHQDFPVMRAGGNWLWDGEREWQEPALREEHRALPHRTTLAHGTLVGYIEAELTDAEVDDEGVPLRPIEYPLDPAPRASRARDEPGQHYLYFARLNKAERAQRVVEGFGFSTSLREAAGGDDWLLLVAAKGDLEEEGDLLERIAEGNDGEYDGSETATA